MQSIQKIEQLTNNIENKDAVLVYFSGKDCSVCEDLKPKIQKAIKENFNKFSLFEVEAKFSRQIASSFDVFSFPTILVFFEQKEFKRYGRNISINLFIEDLKRPYNMIFE